MNCILCGYASPKPLATPPPPASASPAYFHCPACDLRFLDPALRLSEEAERARYLEHNNDISDPRYQDFVRPLFEQIRRAVPKEALGLDYGAGTGPVLSHLLTLEGYQVAQYDPFFFPDKAPLQKTYDFVFACEVAEHFFEPREEFKRLRGLVKPGGLLALMTRLVTNGLDFGRWHYRRDPTHVAFYSEKSFEWIKAALGFSSLEFKESNVILLR